MFKPEKISIYLITHIEELKAKQVKPFPILHCLKDTSSHKNEQWIYRILCQNYRYCLCKVQTNSV